MRLELQVIIVDLVNNFTAIEFVREKIDYTIDRIFAAGVSSPTVILAHFFTHSIVLIIQVTLLLLVAIFGFKIAVEGSVVLVVALLLLLGSTGMAFGLFVSSVARNEADAMQVAMASFFPSMMLSGILWPTEAVTFSLILTSCCRFQRGFDG
jgi:ABC-2 type transport system permease protein